MPYQGPQVRMKKRDIRHIEIFSAWDISSTEIVALRVLKRAYHITSQWLSPRNSKSTRTLCYANFSHTAHVLPATHPAILFLSLFHSHHCPLTKSSCFREASEATKWLRGFETGTIQRSQASPVKIFTGELQTFMKLCSLTRFWRFVSQPDTHSCPEKMLMQFIQHCVLSASLISELST